MGADNVLDLLYRKKIIAETTNQENIQRKKDAFIRNEFYRKRQREYILGTLRQEFDEKTIREMRKITSLSLTERIVNEKASIYKR